MFNRNYSQLMIEIFKTSVVSKNHAFEVVSKLQEIFPNAKFNFDLEDCDKILRVESEIVLIHEIIIHLGEMQIFAINLE